MKTNTNRKALILLSVVAVATMLGGYALATYATDNGQENSNDFAEFSYRRALMLGVGNMPGGGGCRGFIEVSEEFEENVLNIAKGDLDVQALLDDGYNITGVRPIITSMVEADGSVETKATDAIVMLKKDTTSHAAVWVDLNEAKVTKIVILTRAVIEKS